MKIAVIGANGFVGKNLVKFLKKKHRLTKITRKTKFSNLKSNFDIIIHAANSSKKYEASKNQKKDFNNSVRLTRKIIKFFKNNKIILISTISVNNEKNIYSKNRKLCENIVLKQNKKNIIFRLSVLLNYKLKRGILYDLIKGNQIYIDKNTYINPLTIEEVSQYIMSNLKSQKKIHEVGSYNKIKLNTVKKILKSKSKFGNQRIKLTSKKNNLVKFSYSKILNEMLKKSNIKN